MTFPVGCSLGNFTLSYYNEKCCAKQPQKSHIDIISHNRASKKTIFNASTINYPIKIVNKKTCGLYSTPPRENAVH